MLRLEALAGRHELLSDADLEATIAQMRRGFAAQKAERASDAAKREEAEYLDARAALESRLGEFEKAERDCRVVELDDAASDAYSALWDAEQAILETQPTTRAGALALLDCGARYLEDNGSDEQSVVAEAIRNAVAVLEREAQS
ncbi:hypothetical protein [Methylocystis sp.]|uniref:hypothetical protein n=1 Tax=Methylocystis sp. TaxID=1911079 RepID=UPI003D0BF70C